MRAKEKLHVLYQKVDDKFFKQFGFKIKDVTFNKVMDYMYTPKDSSSLAVTRILFGLAMLFDVPDERGGATMEKRWGDPYTCHFPLLSVLTPIPLPYMALVYAALWIGALCIMLGYKYHITAPTFTVCYWYLFLIEKSFWNNHSYLFGLVALLLSCTQADCYWSLDVYLDPSKKKTTVPYWNYFVLKYQFFILYFLAGMKKCSAEWLTGYSVLNLSEHWVFAPFTYFLSVPQTDYFVVHWFVFWFDLTVALWFMLASTRHVAMVLCAMFHLMNSRLFRIGMFPWVCLATMPLFYPFDWPKRVLSYAKVHHTRLRHYVCSTINELLKKSICGHKINNSTNESDATCIKATKETKFHTEKTSEAAEVTTIRDETDVCDELKKLQQMTNGNDNDIGNGEETNGNEVEQLPENKAKLNNNYRKKITMYLIILYVIIQAFLPYSHSITKGYNNWTNGLYGYSWDMMVHTWDISFLVIKVVDNEKNEEMYIDPEQYTLNDRWSRHGDMLYQYAQCLKNNLERAKEADPLKVLSNNISVYADIWYSMNGRFVQRMFDSKVDLLKTTWSPFSKVSYLMPLFDEADHWRSDLDKIRSEVHSWSDNSDVVFLADFPGYEQEKYISPELKNVTLTVLEGIVVYEPAVSKKQIGQSFMLKREDRVRITTGSYHKIGNVGNHPAFYMYTFFKDTEMNLDKDIPLPKNKLPIFRELFKRLSNMLDFLILIVRNLIQLFTFSQCSL